MWTVKTTFRYIQKWYMVEWNWAILNHIIIKSHLRIFYFCCLMWCLLYKKSWQHFVSIVKPFYLSNNTFLFLFSPSDTLFSLLWLTVLVSSGAITCVYGSPHQSWCQHASVPSVQNQALKANVLIHKVEWTTLFGLMDVTYRTYKKLSHFIHVSCFLNYSSHLLLMVFTLPTFTLLLRLWICFAWFSTAIHVLKLD